MSQWQAEKAERNRGSLARCPGRYLLSFGQPFSPAPLSGPFIRRKLFLGISDLLDDPVDGHCLRTSTPIPQRINHCGEGGRRLPTAWV